MSRSRVRLHYSSPTKAALPDDADANADAKFTSDSSDDEPFEPVARRRVQTPPSSSPPHAATPVPRMKARISSPPQSDLRLDTRLITVMDSGQLMPEVRDSLMEEQKYFGNTMSQHDADFAKRFSRGLGNPAGNASPPRSDNPISGRPSDNPNAGSYDQDDDQDDYDDDDYDDDDRRDDDGHHRSRSYTHDDGYSGPSSSSSSASSSSSSSSSSARPTVDKEAQIRKQLRVDYRLLHQSGVVSTKNYNVMTTPLELLVDDLEDLHVDDRIQQWTGIVKDLVVYMAQFMEFVNFRFLNGRFALDGYGRFMESRIPMLRPKIVRVAGMLVKSGATINPIFDLLLAFVGQTIMYIGMNKALSQLPQMPPATPFSTQQSFNTTQQSFNTTLSRQVPQQDEYEKTSEPAMNQRPGVTFFEGDRPTYNGNVVAATKDEQQAQNQQPLNSNAPENPFAKMMSGENNNFLMNIFNAVTGGGTVRGGMGGMGGGLGPEFQQEINSMLPNQGNYNSFEEAMRQGEQDLNASAPKVVAPNILVTHETSTRKRRGTSSSSASLLS